MNYCFRHEQLYSHFCVYCGPPVQLIAEQPIRPPEDRIPEPAAPKPAVQVIKKRLTCQTCGASFPKNRGPARKECDECRYTRTHPERTCKKCGQTFRSTGKKVVCEPCLEIERTHPPKSRAVVDYSPDAAARRSEAQKQRRQREAAEGRECSWCGRLTTKGPYCRDDCRKAMERVAAEKAQRASGPHMNDDAQPPRSAQPSSVPSDWNRQAKDALARLSARGAVLPQSAPRLSKKEAKRIFKVPQYDNAGRVLAE